MIRNSSSCVTVLEQYVLLRYGAKQQRIAPVERLAASSQPSGENSSFSDLKEKSQLSFQLRRGFGLKWVF